MKVISPLSNHLIFLDDDPVFLLIAKKLCNKFESVIRSDFFSTASDALLYLMETTSSATSNNLMVFVDINMPDCNGWDFLNLLEKSCPGFEQIGRVYILSSSTDYIDYRSSKNCKVVKDYIVKPLTISKLGALLESGDAS